MQIESPNDVKLLTAPQLLENLFPEESRPTVCWLRGQQKKRTIPFVKIGHLVFFDPVQVREAIQTRHTVKVKGN